MNANLLIASAAHVPAWTTILFGLILVGLIACLAFEEQLHAKKSIIAGGFAVLSLFLGTALGIFSFEEIVVGSHEATLTASTDAEFVDEQSGQL